MSEPGAEGMLRPPPARGLLTGQVRGLLELPRLVVRWPRLTRLPKGEGAPVLVLPGYGAGDGSTIALQGFLRRLDYRVWGWGLGCNSGDVRDLLPRVVSRLAQVASTGGQRVALIGWSLGGYLAREAARERPDLVRRVVTLGTPVVGGPKYTAVARFYRRRGIDVDAIEAAVDARNRTPLDTPITAIYSRTDGVVAWPACIDHWSANVEHVEVATSHLGFGFAPDVFEIVAERLARPDSRDPS
jgi:pimeloyl-ACP methyl ester carboxylesterase